MAQKTVKERQIGKTPKPVKKSLIDPKYKNTFWTGVVIVILIIFFIINNTREVPDRGPYPPTYNKDRQEQPSKNVSKQLDFDKNNK